MENPILLPVYTKTGNMSLRDWFAGMALQGIISAESVPNSETVASWCYDYADAMLEARSKSTAAD